MAHVKISRHHPIHHHPPATTGPCLMIAAIRWICEKHLDKNVITEGRPPTKGCFQRNTQLVGGFNPSEKYARQNGNLPQIGLKIKNV